jgi:hypothetical protein
MQYVCSASFFSIYLLDQYEFTQCAQCSILLFYYFSLLSNQFSAFLTSFSHFYRVIIMYFPIFIGL